MKLGMYFLPWTTPEVIEGEGISIGIAGDMKARGFDSALVVMGPNMMKRGLPIPMLEEMKHEKIEYRVFDRVTADPTDEHVEDGVKEYRRLEEMSTRPPSIVMFGGGSPMDCGKAIAARIAKADKSVNQLQGILKVHNRKRVPFLYAVPTTSGTGSEATMAAVITDHKTHRKKSINDTSIIPHICVLDSALTRSLPPEITANTGMDALCHAVEAYTNSIYNTKFEDNMAKEAIKLIYDNLYTAYMDGNDIKARQAMQKAAFCAGRAFTRGCVGYVHAIGHTIGGLYGIPHGRAMAVLLPHVMRAYGSAVETKLAELADYCGMTVMESGLNDESGTEAREAGSNGKSSISDNMTVAEKAEMFISWIEDMNDKMDIPAGFDCIRQEDIPMMAKWADEEANPLYPVPVIMSCSELIKLIDDIQM